MYKDAAKRLSIPLVVAFSLSASFSFSRFSFVARGFLGVRLMFSQGCADLGFLASAIRAVPFTPPHAHPASLSLLAFFRLFGFLSGLLGYS